MEVTTTQESLEGPAQMFTGDVWFDVIALWEGDETTWGSHVTDDEYPSAVHRVGR